MSGYDFVKKLASPCTYYLYNNEFETVPSLLGDNIVDLIYNAMDFGMEYFCARYFDTDGNPVCERYRIVPDKKGGPPRLHMLK